jgi:hypothetical protein
MMKQDIVNATTMDCEDRHESVKAPAPHREGNPDSASAPAPHPPSPCPYRLGMWQRIGGEG